MEEEKKVMEEENRTDDGNGFVAPSVCTTLIK